MKISWLVLHAIVSLVTGLSMVFYPERVSDYIIMGVGFLWAFEGIVYFQKAWTEYVEKKTIKIKE